MAIGLLGKKLGMTQIFVEDGSSIPVTVIQAGPCYVVQVKERDTDGYRAVQVGFDDCKESSLTKAELGHLKKTQAPPLRHLHEFPLGEKDAAPVVGSQIPLDGWAAVGSFVDVTGVTIGKGFQGGVKRWHWRGGPETHGSTQHRAPGSVGSTTTPGRTIRGHHLPGRMGGDRLTVQNLQVVKMDPQQHLLAVFGAVPGNDGGLVVIRHAKKQTKTKPITRVIQISVPKADASKGAAKAKKAAEKKG